MEDGLTFQFLQCTGILLVGVMTLVFSLDVPRSPDYEKFPMPDKYALISSEGILGGVVWCLGNLMTIPIVRRVGIGLGLSLWNGTATVVSFLTSRSTMLGLKPQQLHPLWAGYFGALLGVLSLVAFSYIENCDEDNGESNADHYTEIQDNCESQRQQQQQISSAACRRDSQDRQSEGTESSSDVSTPLLQPESNEDTNILYINLLETVENVTNGRVDVLKNKETRNRTEGVIMCLIAGTLYGFQFVPLTVHSMQYPKPENISDIIYQMRFCFSQFLGIYIMSAAAFLIYCVSRQNRPLILDREAIAPSILSGMLWGMGAMGSMVAVSDLGLGIG